MLKIMNKIIAIINGPNINMLGQREQLIYGMEDWNSIERKVKLLGEKLNIELLFYQSNHEGDIVDYIQNNIELINGVVLNPAALSKTGYSILDALNVRNIPYVEVHLSNIIKRGSWHAESIFTYDAIGCIMGLKGYVYELGLLAINKFLEE